MKPNGDPVAKIPVRVYPGIFEGEYQVTINTDQGEVHLNVSIDFVEVDKVPTESGVGGLLKVDIIKENEDRFLVALPGEVQGAPSRVSLSKGLLQVA